MKNLLKVTMITCLAFAFNASYAQEKRGEAPAQKEKISSQPIEQKKVETRQEEHKAMEHSKEEKKHVQSGSEEQKHREIKKTETMKHQANEDVKQKKEVSKGKISVNEEGVPAQKEGSNPHK